MEKDYKIGLLAGMVLAVIGLLWVATRPSLSPEARILRSSRAASRDEPAREGTARTVDTGPLPAPPAGARPPSDSFLTPAGRAQAEASLLPQPIPASPRAPSQESPDRQPSVPDLTIYERSEKITTTRFHIVRKDETLSSISRQYYGSPNRWRKILEANESTIQDANKIRPGVKLIIPD